MTNIEAYIFKVCGTCSLIMPFQLVESNFVTEETETERSKPVFSGTADVAHMF
jgi:hypothetical protein